MRLIKWKISTVKDIYREIAMFNNTCTVNKKSESNNIILRSTRGSKKCETAIAIYLHQY